MSPKGWPCPLRPGLSICLEPPLRFRRSCRCWRGQLLPPARSAIVLSFDLSRNSVVRREGRWLPSAKFHRAIVSTITIPEHPWSSHLHQNPGPLPLAGREGRRRSRIVENVVASIPAESPCRTYHS